MAQRFKSLKVEDKVLNTSKEIEIFLNDTDFNQICLCEIENAELEIKNNILYQLNGIFYYGEQKQGVVKGGEFRGGVQNGGIFLKGLFKTKQKNGVLDEKNAIFQGEKI